MKHTLCWLKMSRKDSSWTMDLSHCLLQVLSSKLSIQSLKQLYLCWYLKFHIKLCLIGKGKNWTFRKKKFALRKPIIFSKNIYIYKQDIFLHNYLKRFSEYNFVRKVVYFVYYIRNIFFLQHLSKTARISVENIERLVIFFKFILWRCQIMQKR